MPVAEVAVDTIAEIAVMVLTAPDALEPMYLPPPPGPGDPDAEIPDDDPVTVWAEPRRGLRARAVLQRTVTHEPIGELTTALVPEWDEDVDEIPTISAEASSWDPLWEAAADRTEIYRGRKVHEWDPKGYELLVGVDAEPMAVGVFRQPLDIGGDRVAIDARGPEALWAERTLGRVEQLDLYEGWGNFETVPVGTEPPGIRKDPLPGQTMTALVQWDAVRGRKCLEVTGGGWIDCPRVPIMGHTGAASTAEGSGFAKFGAGLRDGDPVIQTLTQRADALAPSNLEATVSKQGVRDGDDNGWTIDPYTSGCTFTEDDILHYTWVRVAGHPGSASRYDLVRLQQGVQSGSLIERPYTWYADRFLGDVQNEALGGAPWGMARRVVSESTATAQIQVSHNQNPRFDDVMAQITSVEGGCAVWVDASFTANIAARRGQPRTDVAFTAGLNVVACRWAQDPGSEIDDFVVDTGRGSATSLVTSTVAAPRVAGRHRITRIVRAPSTWTLNRTDAYAARQAAPAAMRNVTCELDIPWAYGRRVACGDSLPVALVDGNLGMWSVPLRVLNKRYRPLEGLITFTMGGSDL